MSIKLSLTKALLHNDSTHHLCLFANWLCRLLASRILGRIFRQIVSCVPCIEANDLKRSVLLHRWPYSSFLFFKLMFQLKTILSVPNLRSKQFTCGAFLLHILRCSRTMKIFHFQPISVITLLALEAKARQVFLE